MKLILSLLLLISILVQFSIGATNNWEGGVNNFNNPTNWSSGKVPGIQDNVVISIEGSIVTVDTIVNVNSINLGGNLNETELIIQNTTTVTTSIVVNSNSTLEITNSTELTATVIQNTGDITLSATDIILNSTFSNLNGGVISAQANSQASVTGEITSNGTIQVNSASLTLQGSLTLNEGSNTQVTKGELNLASSQVLVNGSGEITLSSGNITLNGGSLSLTTQSSLNVESGVFAFSQSTLTLNDQSSIASNDTFTFSNSTVHLFNTSQIVFDLNSQSTSSLTNFYIDDLTYLLIDNGASLSLANDAIYINSGGYLKVNNGNLSINGEMFLQDSGEFFLSNGTFSSTVTQFILMSNSRIVTSNSTFTTFDSTFTVQDSAGLLFKQTTIDTSNTTSTFSVNATLLFQNIQNPTLGSYTFSDNSWAKFSSSNATLVTPFTFNHYANLEVEESTFTISGVANFQQSSSFVSTYSDITFLESSTVSFAPTSSFEVAHFSTVTIDASVTFGVLNVTNAPFTFTNNGVIFVSSFDTTNFTANFDQSSFDEVNLSSTGGQIVLSSNNLTFSGTSATFQNGQNNLAMAHISLVNSNVTFAYLQLQPPVDAQTLQSSDIQMDSQSTITSDITFISNANILGHGDFINNKAFIVQSPNSANISVSNFQNNGDFYFLDNNVYISAFTQNSDSFTVTNATFTVGTFKQTSTGLTTIESTLVATISFNLRVGTLQLNNGTLAATTVLYGSTSGKGTILGSVYNYGHIGTNATICTLTMSNFTQDTTGFTTLYVKDQKTYSSITVTGQTELAGTLTVVLADVINTDNTQLKIKLFNTASKPTGKFDNIIFQLPAGAKQDGFNDILIQSDGIYATFGRNNVINSSSSDDKTKPNKLKPGAVVGIILAILAAIALLSVVGFFARKYLLRRRGIREPLLNRKELN